MTEWERKPETEVKAYHSLWYAAVAFKKNGRSLEQFLDAASESYTSPSEFFTTFRRGTQDAESTSRGKGAESMAGRD